VAPAGIIDWSKARPIVVETPPDDIPLGPRRFQWILGSRTASGLYYGDMVEAVEAYLKEADPGLYREMRSRLNGATFSLADTIALVAMAAPAIAALFPGENLSEQTIRDLWAQAALVPE
jgi:hypothetical protein